MLAKLIALLIGTRPESKEFDYTRQHWGHALYFVRGFKPKGKMEITGHFFGTGLIHEQKPKKGDTFTIALTGNQIGVLRLKAIDFYNDPRDMFYATVTFEGLKS